MEPLTPQDIAEVIVFNVTRRQNVVVADSLVFPTVQVRIATALFYEPSKPHLTRLCRPVLALPTCTESPRKLTSGRWPVNRHANTR